MGTKYWRENIEKMNGPKTARVHLGDAPCNATSN